MKIRPLIPLKLLISAAVLFALSFAARPALNALSPGFEKTSNVLLIAIPFLLIFIPIILAFMSLIVFVSKILHERVPEKVYKSIEYIFVAGIFLGIIAMFQPWEFRLFKIGFFVLFIALLGFMVWSHLAMKRRRERAAETESAEIPRREEAQT